MKKTIILLFSLVLFSWVSSFAQNAVQPSMHFYINENQHPFSNDSLKIIQLQYNTADDKIPVDSIYNGHRNTSKSLICDWPKQCYSSSSVYAPYQKLMFIVNEQAVYSEMFTYTGSHGVYRIDFLKEGVFVRNITPKIFRSDYPYYFYRTALISIIIEILGLYLVLIILKYPDKKRFILASLLANIISLPIYLLITLYLPPLAGFIIGALFLIVFEAACIWYFTKKAGTLGKMILLSFFLNFLSMLAGGAFLFLYSMSGETMNAWFM